MSKMEERRMEDNAQSGLKHVAMFKLSHSTSVKAFVLSCLDPRFRKAVRRFVRQNLGYNRGYDLKLAPGAVAGMNGIGDVANWFINSFEIGAYHGAEEVVLINHLDCLAYGGSGNFENDEQEKAHHRAELERAAAIVWKNFPQMQIRAFLAGRTVAPGSEPLRNAWGDMEIEAIFDFWEIALPKAMPQVEGSQGLAAFMP